MVALTVVEEEDEIMVVTQNGIVSRIKASDISRQGRPATGVRIQNLMENDSVMCVNKIVVTDTKDSYSSETLNENVEQAIQNKLGDIDNNE